MKRTPAAVFALILVGVSSGCHKQQTQQQQTQEPQELSSSVRAAVGAALGPHVSDADLTEFLRSAKLASRTKRDAEVVAMLDEVVSLVRSAAQDDYRAEKYRQHARSAQNAARWNEGMHNKDKAFCETEADMAQFCKEAEENIDSQRKEARHSAGAAQGYENESRKKKQRVEDLVQKLRAELR